MCVEMIQQQLKTPEILRGNRLFFHQFIPMVMDHSGKSRTEETVDLQLIGKRSVAAQAVDPVKDFQKAGVFSVMRIKGKGGQLRRFQIRPDDLKIQKTSRRAVKKRRMDDHGDETRVAAGRRHHMGRICVDDQSVPGIQTERFPSREVEHLPFGNDGDLQLAVPVTADIVVLEVADIVVIDLQRKIRRPVYA